MTASSDTAINARMEHKIYCAMDMANMDDGKNMIAKIAPITGAVKIGLEFFNAFGPQGVNDMMRIAQDHSDQPVDLFLDMKYHDIPNTVAGAIEVVTKIVQPRYITLHCAGGEDMMRAAHQACPDETKLLGVTILTSLNQDSIRDIGLSDSLQDNVIRLAQLAQASGIDGVVCSAHEIEAIRQTCGYDLDLMVPGIRPAGANLNDQKRVMTPSQAIAKGATHLVVGRPITQATDPAAAAQAIVTEISG